MAVPVGFEAGPVGSDRSQSAGFDWPGRCRGDGGSRSIRISCGQFVATGAARFGTLRQASCSRGSVCQVSLDRENRAQLFEFARADF